LSEDWNGLRLGTGLQTARILLGWAFVHWLGLVAGERDASYTSRAWLDEWLFGKILAGNFQDLGMDEGSAWWAVQIVSVMVTHQDWFVQENADKDEATAYQVLRSWLQDSDVQRLIQVNRHQGILWFNRESLEQLIQWMLRIAVITQLADGDDPMVGDRIAQSVQIIQKISEAESHSDYQLEKLLEAVEPQPEVNNG